MNAAPSPLPPLGGPKVQWQALAISPAYDSVTAVECSHLGSLETPQDAPRIQSVTVHVHPDGEWSAPRPFHSYDTQAVLVIDGRSHLCKSNLTHVVEWVVDFVSSGGLVALVISDEDGRSCIAFLTSGLKPLRHIMWYSYEATVGPRQVSSSSPHLVKAAAWMAGTRCLAAIDGAGHLGLVDYTGRFTQIRITATAVRGSEVSYSEFVKFS